jgi:hypothetical protein
MEQAEGFTEDKFEVCLLKKYLYWLKKSLEKWCRQFDKFLLMIGFE